MAKSIIDDPSQWTRKPKDLFDDKVKESLDNRGWGTAGGDTDTDTSGDYIPRTQLLREHRYLREQMETIKDRVKNALSVMSKDVYHIADGVLDIVPKR